MHCHVEINPYFCTMNDQVLSMTGKTLYVTMVRRVTVCAAICVAVLSFVACSGSGVDNYKKVIPKEASLVAAIDLKSVAEDMDITHSPMFKVALSSALIFIDAADKGNLKAVLNDPSLTGIDFSKPAYLFGVKGQVFGVTMKVEDESLTETFISSLVGLGLCSKVVEHDGLSWSTLLDDIGLVWSDNTLLLLHVNSSSRQAGEKLMLAYMRLDEKDAFVSTHNYEMMTGWGDDDDDDIMIYANSSVMPDLMNPIMKTLGVSAVGAANMELVASVDIDDSGFEIESRLFSNDRKTQARLDEFLHSLRPIRGTYAEQVPHGCDMWVYMGVDGDKFLPVLKRIPSVKETLIGANMGVDADKMIRTVDGDVLMLAYGKGTDSGKKIDTHVSVYAQLKDTRFLADVDYWMKSAKSYGIKMARTGDNEYRISGTDSGDLYWAAKDGQLYLGTSMYTPLTRQVVSDVDEDDVHDKLIVGHMDLLELSPLLRSVSFCVDRDGEINIDVHTTSMIKILSDFMH